jgi:hypothetical protein
MLEVLLEARKILQEGITSLKNPSAAFMGLGALADTLLRNMQKCETKQITVDQFLQSQAEIPNIFKNQMTVSRPPSLSPDLAQQIMDYVDRAGPARRQQAEELSVWIKSLCSAPRGAPWKPENYLFGLRAQKTYDELRAPSWMQVAHRICPQKGPKHKCSKQCADRIQQAAKQSKRVAV